MVMWVRSRRQSWTQWDRISWSPSYSLPYLSMMRSMINMRSASLTGTGLMYHLYLKGINLKDILKAYCCGQPWVWHMFLGKACDGLCRLLRFNGFGWNTIRISVVRVELCQTHQLQLPGFSRFDPPWPQQNVTASTIGQNLPTWSGHFL